MQKYKKHSLILPVALIILSVIIITFTTFAIIRTYVNTDSAVFFNKVQISANTSVGANKALHIMPGEPIISEDIAVAKASDSANILVRAKLSFYTNSDNEDMLEMVQKLRETPASEFNITTGEIGNTGVMWSNKIGNYFYLVDESAPTTMHIINNTDSYKFADGIKMPFGIIDGTFDSANDDYIYDDYPIYVIFAFEAIQAEGIADRDISSVKSIFDTEFPVSNDEDMIDDFTVEFDAEGSNDEPTPVLVENGMIALPDDLGVKNINYTLDGLSSTAQVEFIGWQDDRGNFYEPGAVVTITRDTTFTAVWPTDGIVFTTSNISNSLSFASPSPTKNAQISANLGKTGIIRIPGVFASGGNVYQVNAIGDNAFKDNAITGLYIYGTINSIGASAFSGCTTLKNLHFENNVTQVGDNAFYNCRMIEEIDLSLVQTIGNNAFENCYKLANINIENVTTLGVGAFKGCAKITDITLNGQLTTIPDEAFANTGIESVEFGEGIMVIGESAFENTKMNEVSLPSTLKTINENAFAGATNLNSINASDKITNIGENAFSNTAFYNNNNSWSNNGLYITTNNGKKYLITINTGITGTLTMDENTILVADKAGYNCEGLTGIVISESIENIGDDAFVGTGLYNESQNWSGNALYVMDTNGDKCLLDSEIATSTYTVASGTKVLLTGCFANSSALQVVTMPSSLVKVQENVFTDTNIYSVDMTACTALSEFAKQDVTTNFVINLPYVAQANVVGTAIYDVILESNTSNAFGIMMEERLKNTSASNTSSILQITDGADIIWNHNYSLSNAVLSQTTQKASIIFRASSKSNYNFKYETSSVATDNKLTDIRIVASMSVQQMDNYTNGTNTVTLYQNEGTNNYNKSKITISTSEQSPANTVNKTIQATMGKITILMSTCTWEWSSPCFTANTLVTLADGSVKYAKDITYNDLLLCWDFDRGCYTASYPVWIAKTDTREHDLYKVKYSDGTCFDSILNHRIYIVETHKFEKTYDTLMSNIGRHVFAHKINNDGSAYVNTNGQFEFEAKQIVDIEYSVVEDQIYNIVTGYQLNIFTSATLTSCGFSNMFGNFVSDSTVENFVADMTYNYSNWSGALHTLEDINQYATSESLHIPEYLFKGFRAAEQKDTRTASAVYEYLKIDLLCRYELQTNASGDIIWAVSTSNDAMNPTFAVAGQTYTLPTPDAVQGKTFEGWYCTSNGQTYQTGDSVVIEMGSYFEALWA